MKKKITMYYDPQVGSHPQYFVASFHLSPERIESCPVLSFITKTSSGQDHRGPICVMENMAFLWTWHVKWVDSYLLLGSMPNPYGGLKGFLKEKLNYPSRVGLWGGRCRGRMEELWFGKENQGNKISLLISETQLPSLYMPSCCNLCFWV